MMSQLDVTNQGEIGKLVERVRRLETQSVLENASITRGRTRIGGSAVLLVDSSGGIVIHGRLQGDGTITWTGVSNLNGTNNLNGTTNLVGPTNATGAMGVNGPLTVNGTWTLIGAGSITGNVTSTGTFNQNGPWNLAGTGGITGNVSSTGAWTQSGNFTLTGSGKVIAGSGMFLGPTTRGPGLQFDNGATISQQSYGLGMTYSDTVYIGAGALGTYVKYGSYGLATTVLGTRVDGPMNVVGAFTASSKSFKIPHPLKDDTWLLHGVTESPVHGVEYWGDEVMGADGTFRVELPDYFPALTLEAGRAVFVTGRGHSPDWSDIVGRHFTVTGAPGKRFSWLVKAARSDVILQTEEPMEPVTGP